MVQRELTDEQWSRIAPHLPEPRKSPKGGRTPRPNRACFEGLLWVLRTGARWKDVPDCFPSGSTCWRRLRDWDEVGAWEAAWHAFIAELGERDRTLWEVVFADAMFVPAKKGATNRSAAKHGSENAFRCRRQAEIKGLADDGVWKSASSENFRLRRRVSGRQWPTLTGESLRFGQRSGGLSTPPPRRTSLRVHCCRDRRLRMLDTWRNFDIFTDAPERLTHAGDQLFL